MPSRHFFRRAFLVFAIFSAFLGARAATWVLANGDRLNGTLVQETDAAVVIEHAQLGRMTIPRAALQGTVTETPAAPNTATGPRAVAAATSATPTAQTATQSRAQWSRQLEFGFAMQEGAKSSRDLSLRAQIEGRVGSNSLRGTARVLRAESQGLETKNRDEADLRWRHDFNRRIFTQALTTFSSDEIRQIDYSLEQQIGGGYRIVDGARQQMNIGLGAVLQQQARKGYEDETVLLGSAFQDFAFSWTDRLKLTQESSVQFSDNTPAFSRNSAVAATAPSNGNYRFKFNTALQTKMTDQMSLNLRFEYDYDHSIPEVVLRGDSRLTTSLGYTW